MARFTYELLEDTGFDTNPLEWTEPTDGRGYYVMAHNRYNVPKEIDIDFDDFENWAEAAEEAKKLSGFKEPQVEYIRWYEHSGVAISLVSTPNIGGWDSGCAGFVVYEKEDTDYATGAFQEYAAYVAGDVYGVEIRLDGEATEEASWGHLGYTETDNWAKEHIAELNKLTDVEIKQRFGRKAGVRASALHK